MRGGVADQLVYTDHVRFIEPRQSAIVCHSDEDGAAFGVGEGSHLRRQGISIADILLELAAAVFAQGDGGFELS